MITQCSVFEGALKSLTESPLKVLDGNQTTYPAAQLKTIRFQKKIDESEIQDLIDTLNANTDSIMALISWGSSFFWDFDVNPVLDIHHSQQPSGAPTTVSGYNSQTAESPDPDANGFFFDQTGFSLKANLTWTIATCGIITYQVYVTWVLYEGPAKMLHNYNEFIGDPSLLQPAVKLTLVPPPVLSGQGGFGSTTIPVVVLDPIPFSRPYKIPVPDYQENYFNENNFFQAK